tara:strand:- start:122 stop:445 length:324 start_codon:yes stop_codon:yes gene_type:complete
MIIVNLEPATNGVVKRVINQNAGGGRETVASVNVFELNHDGTFLGTKQFLFELCEDLGIKTGNKFEKNNLKMTTEWGSHYEPTEEEVKTKIEELEIELQLLKKWKKV